jgi:hypothetical protein
MTEPTRAERMERDAPEIWAALKGQKPTNPEAWDVEKSWGFGDIEFVLPNGWRVVVNQRRGEWSCVASVEAPDGRTWDPWPDSSEYGGDEPPTVHRLAYAHPRDPAGWGLAPSDEERIRQWNEGSEHAVTW